VATAEDPYSRSFALFAIGKIKSPAVHEALPEAVGALMHPDKEVRDSAARTLGKIVESVPPLSLTVRRRHEIFDALLRAIADPQPAVRAKAVRSLGKLARYGYLDEEMRGQALARIEAIITRGEETDWDHAFIVRREAQETLSHLRAGAR
jgi:HEAT repeat protein